MSADTLPPEMWASVLQYLPPSSLCNLCLVSRYLHQVTSCPSLWISATINTSKVLAEGLNQLLSIPRFSRITKLNLSNLYQTGRQLQEILTTVRDKGVLEDLDLSCVNLAEVPVYLVAQGVCRLRRVSLANSLLTSQQCVAILSSSLHSTTLQHVNLCDVNLSQVPSHLLSSAISRIRHADLGFTKLTTAQSCHLLGSISASSITEQISLRRVNLSGVPAELLRTVVGHLRSVDLGFTKLTTEQATAVLSATSDSSSIRDLTLWGNLLDEVPLEVVARCIPLLDRANLQQTRMTPDQCHLLLSRSLESSSLQDLNLGHMSLASIPSDLLASAVARLGRSILTNTKLTTAQSTALLPQCRSSHIQYLDLSFVNLVDVATELLDQPGKTIYI